MNNDIPNCIDNSLNIYSKDANICILSELGMMRNSFLLQKDYLFNLPVVGILCKDEYRQLIQFVQKNQTKIVTSIIRK